MSSFKTIWITGASSGLGEALALHYAQQKTTLILSSNDGVALKNVAEKCESKGSQVIQQVFDLSNKTELEQAIHVITSNYEVDLFISNAGIGQRSLAIETTEEVEKRIMEINYWPAVSLSKAVLPGMMKRNFGHIAVVSSISGLFSFPNRSSYSASKHALMGYFEGLSIELAHTNIGVTLVCPGRLKNEFSLSALTANGEKFNKQEKTHENGVPLETAVKKITKAISGKKRYLIFGKKEVLLWYAKRISPALFFKLASGLKGNT